MVCVAMPLLFYRDVPALYLLEPYIGSMEFKLITLSPLKRRIVYVTLFEIFAILLSTLLLMLLSGGEAQESLPVATVVSFIAVAWNYAYNLLFEKWERKRQATTRSLYVRVMHSLGFEAGLLVFTLPLYMIWYSVGLWVAFTMVAALLVFFLVYTFVFTLIFDQFFTLPQNHKQKTSHLGEAHKIG